LEVQRSKTLRVVPLEFLGYLAKF